MAAPVDSARVGTNKTSAGTSQAVNVGSPAANDLLIVFARFSLGVSAITFTGYTLLAGPSAPSGADDVQAVWYRWADGTEGVSDTMSWTTSSKASFMTWVVTGAEDPSIRPPVISTVATGSSADTADPGSVGIEPPIDTLYIVMSGSQGESSYTAAPTNYINLATANSGTSDLSATNCFMGGASREILDSSSDNAGAFTHGSGAWAAYAVAINEPLPPDIVFLPYIAPTTVVYPPVLPSLPGRLSQLPVEALVLPTSATLRLSQAPVEALVLPTSATLRLTQMAVEVLVRPEPSGITTFLIID